MPDASPDHTVLVVDDEPTVLHLLTRVLTAEGFRVLSAESAREALDVMARESVEVLLTDLVMPETDGEVLANLAEHLPHPPRILLMSGFAEAHQREDLRWPLIKKPFDIDSLVRALLGS